MNTAAAPTMALTQISGDYVRGGRTKQAKLERSRATEHFIDRFESLHGWRISSVEQRMRVAALDRAFAAYAAVVAAMAVDAEYVVESAAKWGKHVAGRNRLSATTFRQEAASLGFVELEIDKMWSKLAQICVITGQFPDTLTQEDYIRGKEEFRQAVIAKRGRAPCTLTTPLFGLDAVMFHRGQGPQPTPRKPWMVRSVHETQWDVVTSAAPQISETMQRYLEQVGISLRSSSVKVIDTTLRQLAGLLIADHPEVSCVAQIGREHIEAYKVWLAARRGYRKHTTLSKTTLGMRLGHLRAFFQRITEWDYHDVPNRIPVFASDRPIKNKPLPKFLDDPTAAKFMAAARTLPDQFDRLAIEILARTGMRKGELLALTVDAVVQIGSAYWLRTPIGKLHNDRYIPLHPTLKQLIDDWLDDRPDWQDSNLLLTEKGRPIPPSRVDQAVKRAAADAGVGHVHPHQLRHTLATQAINRGMSLEAIAALLGHKTMTMTMVYARIADRTVAEEYFQVTEKVEALYHDPSKAILPAETEGTVMRQIRTETHRLLGNGYCARPEKLDCHFETICEGCTFFLTTIEFRPTLQRQRDDAACKGQIGRQAIFNGILERLDHTGT